MNEFYEQCAQLLGCDYEGQPFQYYKRTRWNNRKPGQGRFPGYGIIREFGDQIHVALKHPVLHTKIYNSRQEVLDFLMELKDK